MIFSVTCRPYRLAQDAKDLTMSWQLEAIDIWDALDRIGDRLASADQPDRDHAVITIQRTDGSPA